jgi:hypothetical protein
MLEENDNRTEAGEGVPRKAALLLVLVGALAIALAAPGRSRLVVERLVGVVHQAEQGGDLLFQTGAPVDPSLGPFGAPLGGRTDGPGFTGDHPLARIPWSSGGYRFLAFVRNATHS